MISIVIPSMGREQRLDVILTQFESEIPDDAEIIVVMDEQHIIEKRKKSLVRRMDKAHPKTKFILSKIRGCWRSTSLGFDHAKNEFIMWTADDINPHPGWFRRATERFEKVFPDGLGLMILNDLHMLDQVAGHAMTTKRFLWVLFEEAKFPPRFYHLFCDTLVADWAKSINRCHFCENAILEHMHYSIGKMEQDETSISARRGEPETDDKIVKDDLDTVWYFQGGRGRALARLNQGENTMTKKKTTKKTEEKVPVFVEPVDLPTIKKPRTPSGQSKNQSIQSK